jgi:hypothetical protein
MNYLSDYIKKESKDIFGIEITVSEKRRSYKDMEKDLFIECITSLKEIDDKSTFLIEEMGINIVSYEDKFYTVIEGLMKMRFNEDQLEVISTFLQKEEDVDKVTLRIDDEEKDFNFDTPAELYKIVTLLES